MSTLRNKKKLATLIIENCEKHPRSNLAQNSNVPRWQEDYITQVSEEIEGRVTKKLSQELSRTENRILGALARLDDFLINPLIRGHSGTAPEMSRNALSTSQGTNKDDSKSDPHPEAGVFHNQRTQNSGLENGHDNFHLLFLSVCSDIAFDTALLAAQIFANSSFFIEKMLFFCHFLMVSLGTPNAQSCSPPQFYS